MNKNVYYIVEVLGIGFLKPALWGYDAEDRRGTRGQAEQFRSVCSAISAVQSYAQKFGNWGIQIIRVEETPGPPRRELVTTGDLSLLDKGPVVIATGRDSADFVRPKPQMFGSWTSDLSAAQVFANLAEALAYIATNSAASVPFYPGTRTSLKILPIREIPGTPTVTETVLA